MMDRKQIFELVAAKRAEAVAALLQLFPRMHPADALRFVNEQKIRIHDGRQGCYLPGNFPVNDRVPNHLVCRDFVRYLNRIPVRDVPE